MFAEQLFSFGCCLKVRPSDANEFYLNSSVSVFMAQFLDTVRLIDDSRPVHEANPTCVAIRHGPYTFDPSQYGVYGALCGDGIQATAGCVEQGETTGNTPSNPFEWDEVRISVDLCCHCCATKRLTGLYLQFGATALADLDTLTRIIPPEELAAGWQTAASPSWSFHRLTEWGNVGGYRGLFSQHGAAPTLADEVRHSQWLQAEGLRYMFQAHRRAKPHRSAANSWTFNEPWPNAAHGSVLSFSGVPKQSFYYTRAAMAMLDISLHYTALTVQAGVPLRNSSVTVWVDSELDTTLADCDVKLEYIDPSKFGELALLATEHHMMEPLPAGTGRQLTTGLCAFVPPAAMASNNSVLLARVLLQCPGIVTAQNTYTFAVLPATAEDGAVREEETGYKILAGLIPADRTNFTKALTNHQVCESMCNASTLCRGYTTDQTPKNCWLYDTVHALAPSPADAFHLKPGVPEPPHGLPIPPPPPPPSPLPAPAILAALTTAPATTLVLGAATPLSASGNDIGVAGRWSFSVTNSGSGTAVFARISLKHVDSGEELGYALFTENFACLLPAESTNVTVTLAISDGSGKTTPKMLCVEAWNAAQLCTGPVPQKMQMTLKTDDILDLAAHVCLMNTLGLRADSMYENHRRLRSFE